jgi:hypothetical protein
MWKRRGAISARLAESNEARRARSRGRGSGHHSAHVGSAGLTRRLSRRRAFVVNEPFLP